MCRREGSISERNTRDEAVVKIACVQMGPVVGEKERNVRRTVERIEEAAGNGAGLIGLPELCNSGYVFDSREEAFALGEEIPGGPTCQTWIEVARTRGVHLVAGISERDGEVLYNAAVVIGPSGFVGKFRKNHLWNEENLFFEPGNLGFPVFKTPIGRIGTLICYDGWFPESYRLCALQGADIVCIPTNWVPIPRAGQEPRGHGQHPRHGRRPGKLRLRRSRRPGRHRAGPALHRPEPHRVVYRWPIAGPASPDKEEILYAEANLAGDRRKRNWNEYNQVLRDRRTDVYDEMLGAKANRGWY